MKGGNTFSWLNIWSISRDTFFLGTVFSHGTGEYVLEEQPDDRFSLLGYTVPNNPRHCDCRHLRAVDQSRQRH